MIYLEYKKLAFLKFNFDDNPHLSFATKLLNNEKVYFIPFVDKYYRNFL